MKPPTILMVLTALGVSAPATAQETPMQNARQTAEAISTKLDAAYNKHDAAGIARLYVMDATFVPARPIPPLGAVITGREGIEKYFTTAFKTFTHETGKIVAAGPLDNDAVWFVRELHLTGRSEGGLRRIDGHVGGVLVESGGSWQIRMTVTNGRPQGLATRAGAHAPSSTKGAGVHE